MAQRMIELEQANIKLQNEVAELTKNLRILLTAMGAATSKEVTREEDRDMDIGQNKKLDTKATPTRASHIGTVSPRRLDYTDPAEFRPADSTQEQPSSDNQAVPPPPDHEPAK